MTRGWIWFEQYSIVFIFIYYYYLEKLVPKLRSLLNSFLKLHELSLVYLTLLITEEIQSHYFIIQLMIMLVLVHIEWYYCIPAVLAQYFYCSQPQYFGGVLGLGWPFPFNEHTTSYLIKFHLMKAWCIIFCVVCILFV